MDSPICQTFTVSPAEPGGFPLLAKQIKGFTNRYNRDQLVWFEQTADITAAIAREKQIKAGSRKRKEALIAAMNPTWDDLARDWYEDVG